ncbi:MAG: GNAT family N-acetyltransferase, partial [Pseudomonadota bacterium]
PAWLKNELDNGSYFVWVECNDHTIAINCLTAIEGNAIHIRRFAVAPAKRRKGVGRELIKQISNFAR